MRISPYAKLPIVMHLEGTICAVELRVGTKMRARGARSITAETDCPLRGDAISFYQWRLVYVVDPDRGTDEDDGDDIDHWAKPSLPASSRPWAQATLISCGGWRSRDSAQRRSVRG
jgi:hypothetical protein